MAFYQQSVKFFPTPWLEGRPLNICKCRASKVGSCLTTHLPLLPTIKVCQLFYVVEERVQPIVSFTLEVFPFCKVGYRIGKGGHKGTLEVPWGLVSSHGWLTLTWSPVWHLVPVSTRTSLTTVIDITITWWLGLSVHASG